MLKRPLFLATALFFAGIIFSAYNIKYHPFIIVFLLLSSVAFYLGKKSAIYIMASVMLFSGFSLAEYADYKKSEMQSRFSGLTQKMTVTVSDFPVDNRVIIIFKDGKKDIKAYLTVEEDISLFPGDVIEGEFTLYRPLKGRTQLSIFAERLEGKGVFLTAEAEKVALVGHIENGFAGKIYSLRRFMNNLGKRRLNSTERALFNAMVFGDKSLISDSLYDALQSCGLNHIVVVSGLHISVVISFITYFIHKLFGKSRFSVIPAFFGALALTVISGAGASVIRAFIMCSVYLASRILYRDNDSLTSLGIAALTMAVINPFIIYNAGFILSVLSILGILLYNERFCNFLKWFMPEKPAAVISLSLSAQFAVMPALAYYFGMITPYALISNLLVVTIASLYVIAGMVFLIFPQSVALLWILKISTQGIVTVCRAAEKLPLAVINLENVDFLFIILWGILLVLAAVFPSEDTHIYKKFLPNNKFMLQR